MENNNAGKKYFINTYVLAFIVAALILFFYLMLTREIYLPIGKNLCDYTGDGLKNFYTFAYYLKYGKGLNFTGLFYPFSEQIVYMDAQPLWVWIIKSIETVFHFHVENPVIYIHFILFFNLFLCGFFIFLILFHFCKDYYFTVIGTFIIVLMSPQIFRFSSHFALGNMGIIPLFWWWYICISSHKKIIPHVLFSFALLLVGYIHPYLLLMMVFLLLSYEVIASIVTKKISWLKIISVLAALVLFQISLKLTDNITDRPTRAWGAKEYACKLHDVLLPLTGCVKDYFIKIIPTIQTGYTEGHGYISIFGILVLLILIFKLFKLFFKKQLNPNLTNGSTGHWVFASVPVLLFAFFIPFRWHMDWLINLIAPLKQFRGTGRFIAVFYYVYLVFVFVYLKKLFDSYKKIIAAVMAIGIVICISDIYNNTNYIVEQYEKCGKPDAYHYFKEKSTLFFSKVKEIKEYQCIIPYPPSTEGTEVMWLDADWATKINYFWLSYFYHLPLATVHSSRASFSNTMFIVQLSGYKTMPKPIVDKLDKTKKCLVMVNNTYINEDIPLIKNAVFISSFDNLSLLSLDLNTLKNSAKKNLNFDWIDTTKYTLLNINHFDKLPKGVLSLMDKEKKINVLTIHVADDKKDKKLRVLFWYTPKLNNDSDIPIMGAYNVIDNQEVLIHDWRERHTNTYNYTDGWFCVDYLLDINNETTTVKFKLASDKILADDVAVYLQK